MAAKGEGQAENLGHKVYEKKADWGDSPPQWKNFISVYVPCL